MNQQIVNKSRIVWVHLFFWAMYFSFFLYQITFGHRNDDDNFGQSFLDATEHVGLQALIAYFNYFILLPRYLKSKNIGRYLLELALPFILVVLIQLLFKRYIYGGHLSSGRYYFNSTKFILQHVINVIFVIGFISMLRFAKDWFELDSKRQEMENEKLTAELRFLKDQINPHFLFNTLNNLYYLAHSQSPKTKDVVAKLSQIMRYMIYDSNQERVAVSKEVEYIENYLSLEKMRLEDTFTIEFKKTGAYEHLRIAPFIFITFLENAFKHGTASLSHGEITISIHFEGNVCHYQVKNQIAPNSEKTEKSGIGLKNIKRRLNLEYPAKHQLTLEENRNFYIADLKIEL